MTQVTEIQPFIIISLLSYVEFLAPFTASQVRGRGAGRWQGYFISSHHPFHKRMSQISIYVRPSLRVLAAGAYPIQNARCRHGPYICDSVRPIAALDILAVDTYILTQSPHICDMEILDIALACCMIMLITSSDDVNFEVG